MAHTSKALKVLAVSAGGSAASLVIPELLKRGVDLRAFAHKAEAEPIIQKLGVTDIVMGELADAAAVARAVAGVEAVSTSRRLRWRTKPRWASRLWRQRSRPACGGSCFRPSSIRC